MPKVAVLIPCYNEELTIEKVVRDSFKALPDAVVYVYDNNSTDNTAKIAKNAGAIVVKEPKQGKGNVIRSMFKDIDADVYIMVDGDDTYGFESAPEMANLILNHNVDMVIGDRLSGAYYEENKRPFHNFGNKLVKAEINLFFQAHISDVMTGFRAFSKKFVKSFDIKSNGFEIETEMSIFAVENKFKLATFPIVYRDRPKGSESKLNTTRDGIKVLFLIYKLFRHYKPLRFNVYISVICLIVGLLLSLLPTTMIAKIIGYTFLGVSLAHFILGIVFHYICKANKEKFQSSLN